jgi:hypothetical protein
MVDAGGIKTLGVWTYLRVLMVSTGMARPTPLQELVPSAVTVRA